MSPQSQKTNQPSLRELIDVEKLSDILSAFSAATPPNQAPSVAFPPGLRPLAAEGFGEVQTPLQGPAARSLRVGDVVWARPAKAGELAERFSHYVLLRESPDGGYAVERRAPTYRGLGHAFH